MLPLNCVKRNKYQLQRTVVSMWNGMYCVFLLICLCHIGNWLGFKLYYSPNPFLVSQTYKLPSFKNYIGCNMLRNIRSIFILKSKQLFHELMIPPWHTYSINIQNKSLPLCFFLQTCGNISWKPYFSNHCYNCMQGGVVNVCITYM